MSGWLALASLPVYPLAWGHPAVWAWGWTATTFALGARITWQAQADWD